MPIKTSVTRYGLDGPEFKPRRENEIFLFCFPFLERPWCLLYNGYRDPFPGLERQLLTSK
jgi:hypothetical protein